MRKRIIIRNGKKYIVNTPDYGGCGWEDGIGAGAQVGTLWMVSSDGQWYTINASGSAPLVGIYVDQTSLGYADNNPGLQLLTCDDGNKYFVYLTGAPTSVAFTVSQSAYTGSADGKPDLLLRSINDGDYYVVVLHNDSGTIEAFVSQSVISASWMPV
jgi:hypothetical protein